MGSSDGHIVLARQSKNNFLACWESEHGNSQGMIQHVSLAVEHLLKAVIAAESGGETDTRGHSLAGLLQTVRHTDVSQFEDFIYDLDGMYTQARYDEGFSSGVMRNPERIQSNLEQFISFVERVVA